MDFQFLALDFQIQDGGSQDFLIQKVSGSTVPTTYVLVEKLEEDYKNVHFYLEAGCWPKTGCLHLHTGQYINGSIYDFSILYFRGLFKKSLNIHNYSYMIISTGFGYK